MKNKFAFLILGGALILALPAISYAKNDSVSEAELHAADEAEAKEVTAKAIDTLGRMGFYDKRDKKRKRLSSATYNLRDGQKEWKARTKRAAERAVKAIKFRNAHHICIKITGGILNKIPLNKLLQSALKVEPLKALPYCQ